MIFSWKRTPPSFNISLSSTTIPIVDSTLFLGVTISNKLKWNSHISATCAKARKQLGFMYRFFHGADSATLSYLYKCLVLPHLDYCSAVWDPSTITLINKLESVQKFVAKLVTKCWSTPSDYLLPSLNWCTLQVRRRRQKAMICRRILYGSSIIPASHSSHSMSLIPPFATTSCYQSSFFVSSVVLWNQLPESLIGLTSSFSFRCRLKTCII